MITFLKSIHGTGSVQVEFPITTNSTYSEEPVPCETSLIMSCCEKKVDAKRIENTAVKPKLAIVVIRAILHFAGFSSKLKSLTSRMTTK